MKLGGGIYYEMRPMANESLYKLITHTDYVSLAIVHDGNVNLSYNATAKRPIGDLSILPVLIEVIFKSLYLVRKLISKGKSNRGQKTRDK